MSVALRKESVDRNLNVPLVGIKHYRSLSARRAWIEINQHNSNTRTWGVALRKESVDRNMLFLSFPPVAGVALRKESVDRNLSFRNSIRRCLMSLSARRAWIEMAKL